MIIIIRVTRLCQKLYVSTGKSVFYKLKKLLLKVDGAQLLSADVLFTFIDKYTVFVIMMQCCGGCDGVLTQRI